MSWIFAAPPGWPVPPGFVPPTGWVPDPSWPPAPADWNFWVAAPVASVPVAADAAGAAPAPLSDADPYRVPPPGQGLPPVAGPAAAPIWGAPTDPAWGAPPQAGYPGYGAGGYGQAGYGQAGYPPPGYGAAPYSSAPTPRRGLSGWIIGLIVAIVVLLIVAVVGGVFAVGRLVGNTAGPLIKSDAACSDALTAIDYDSAAPTKEQAATALPDLQAAQDRARRALTDSTFVDSSSVVEPIQKVIDGYKVFSSLPDDPATWTNAQRVSADGARADISTGYDQLDSFCGIGDGSGPSGDPQSVSG